MTGKRKSQAQVGLEEKAGPSERWERYEAMLPPWGEGRNSYSKTDPMPPSCLKEDHMRNGQLKPGYTSNRGK